MGFSLTGSHVVFFISSVIIASAVSGVLIAVTHDVNVSLSDRGNRVQEQLDTDFKIINDPDNIPSPGSYYLFYLKNIGGNELATTNTTFSLFVDGELITTSNYNFTDDTTYVGDVTTIYVKTSVIPSGSHVLRVVGPHAVEEEFAFTVS